MRDFNRRQWLSVIAAGLPMSRTVSALGRAQAPPKQAPTPLELKDFQPRSMLEVPSTRVPRARVPVIDFHTHLGFRAARTGGVPQGEEPGLPLRLNAASKPLHRLVERLSRRASQLGIGRSEGPFVHFSGRVKAVDRSAHGEVRASPEDSRPGPFVLPADGV